MANVDDKAGYKLNVDTDVLFDAEFQKIDVMVAFNGDFAKPYLLKSITTVPTKMVVTSQDLVDAVDELNSIDDIAERQTFSIFTNITLTDGTFIPGYLPNGKPTYSPSVINVMDIVKEGLPSVRIAVPCTFFLEDYLGIKDVNDYWDGDEEDYDAEVILDPADPDPDDVDIWVIVKGVHYDETWDLHIVLSKYDYRITGPEQLMGPEYGPYTNPTWDKISGTIETCDKALVVLINSFCIDQGCFGGLPLILTISSPEDEGEDPGDGDGDGVKKSTGTVKIFPAPPSTRKFRMVQ